MYFYFRKMEAFKILILTAPTVCPWKPAEVENDIFIMIPSYLNYLAKLF